MAKKSKASKALKKSKSLNQVKPLVVSPLGGGRAPIA